MSCLKINISGRYLALKKMLIISTRTWSFLGAATTRGGRARWSSFPETLNSAFSVFHARSGVETLKTTTSSQTLELRAITFTATNCSTSKIYIFFLNSMDFTLSSTVLISVSDRSFIHCMDTEQLIETLLDENKELLKVKRKLGVDVKEVKTAKRCKTSGRKQSLRR